MIGKGVKKYCIDKIELIENYEKAIKDKKRVWHCHHRLEITYGFSQNALIKLNMYYGRPASELVFLKPGDHSKLHNKNKNKEWYISNVENSCDNYVKDFHSNWKQCKTNE